MTKRNNQNNQFDNFVKQQVDRKLYSYDPSAWKALSNMLDDHQATVPPDSNFERILSITLQYWRRFLLGIVFTLLLSTIWISTSKTTVHDLKLKPLKEVVISSQSDHSLTNQTIDKNHVFIDSSNGSSKNINLERGNFDLLEMLPRRKLLPIRWSSMNARSIDSSRTSSIETVLKAMSDSQEVKKVKHLIW